jgi:hypothetical protein
MRTEDGWQKQMLVVRPIGYHVEIDELFNNVEIDKSFN